MKVFDERAKRGLVLALTLVIGFGSGFLTKELSDRRNSAVASEVANVPVQKVQNVDAERSNHLVSPHLWDVYVDPLLVPVQWVTKPLPLLQLIDLPTDIPKVQTIDSEKELRVIAQVPGMSEKDVKVQASEHAVTIKAHKNQEQKGDGRFETYDESFEQSVHLPCKVNADKVQACVKDGVLTVTLPKS